MDLPMMIGVGIGALLFIIVEIIAVAMTLKRIFGGNKMKPKPMKKQLEEIQEPNEEEIEMAGEGDEELENDVDAEEQPNKAICMILVEGGKAYRGEFLGEDAQFVTTPEGKLIKQDSVWVKMKTEKTPLLVINKRHIILMAFENLPTVQVPTKPKPQKQKEETEAEGAIEDMTI